MPGRLCGAADVASLPGVPIAGSLVREARPRRRVADIARVLSHVLLLSHLLLRRRLSHLAKSGELQPPRAVGAERHQLPVLVHPLSHLRLSHLCRVYRGGAMRNVCLAHASANAEALRCTQVGQLLCGCGRRLMSGSDVENEEDRSEQHSGDDRDGDPVHYVG